MPQKQDCAEFGKLIRKLRKKKGLTQEVFADEAGLDVSYIGRIERGQVNLGLTIIYQIAAALKISPRKLLKNSVSHRSGSD